MLAVAAEDDGRPVELLQHARRDDAHDADVPGQLAFDDDEIGLRVELGAHRADDFLGDAAFDLLALAVARVQVLRERQRFGEVAGQQQAQGFFGGFQPAGGVEARRELEADFVGAEPGGDCATLFSATSPGRWVAFSRSRPAETRMRFSPVSGTMSAIVPSATRSSNGRRSNSAAPGRPVSRPRLTRAWASLKARPAEQSSVNGGMSYMSYLSCLGCMSRGLARMWSVEDGGRGQGRQCELRIDQGNGGGRRGANLVMVQDDDIHAPLSERGDGFHGGRAAVHGEQQRGRKFLQAILHASWLRP